MIISICIATYKREFLLDRLLESLMIQELPNNLSLEIVVVDNDSKASAKTILQKFNNTNKIFFKYFVQAEKNISLTRNEGVKNASGEFICFIDDDEIVSSRWVISLYNSLVNFNADGAFGYTEPMFDENIPDYLQHREFYFSAVGETGTNAVHYFTTNTIIKSDLIKSEAIPFEPSYGLTGGSDVHLFERLKRKGAKFINCKEALAYEFIPSDRGTKRYVFDRALRGGQAFVRRRLEQNNKISNQLLILGKAYLKLLYSTMKYYLAYNSNFYKVKSLQIIGATIGKVRGVLEVYFQIY